MGVFYFIFFFRGGSPVNIAPTVEEFKLMFLVYDIAAVGLASVNHWIVQGF